MVMVRTVYWQGLHMWAMMQYIAITKHIVIYRNTFKKRLKKAENTACCVKHAAIDPHSLHLQYFHIGFLYLFYLFIYSMLFYVALNIKLQTVG